MLLMDKVKTALRIKSTAFDDGELAPLISACKLDLKLAGVTKIDPENDPLACQAVVLYVKARFGFDENSDRYARAYEALKNAMALSGDYGGVASAIP